jgi:molybdopterin adenylyltransferase
VTDEILVPADRRVTDDDGHDVIDPLYVAVVTVSSSRASDDDPGGDAATNLIEEAGGRVTVRELVRDDFAAIRGTVDRLASRADVDCIVTTGGTGVTMDDVTPAACEGLFEREIPGFGELFRAVSYEEIGHRAMASRATAGVVSGTPTFCLPGSRGAVRTGMAELVLPEAPHLAGLATRHRFDRHATDAEP